MMTCYCCSLSVVAVPGSSCIDFGGEQVEDRGVVFGGTLSI